MKNFLVKNKYKVLSYSLIFIGVILFILGFRNTDKYSVMAKTQIFPVPNGVVIKYEANGEKYDIYVKGDTNINRKVYYNPDSPVEYVFKRKPFRLDYTIPGLGLIILGFGILYSKK